MARSTFPDKELSVQAIKALMAARSLPPSPERADALKKAAQLYDSANSYHQLFLGERAGPPDRTRS
jgi:hypothetical protein